MTAEMLDAQSPLPVIAARLVGLRELAVALRLILRTCCASDRSGRPVAAAGLVVLMICATMLSLIPISRDPVMMLLTGTVGIVAACVGYARLRLAPLRLC
jgi:hypothetical protein